MTHLTRVLTVLLVALVLVLSAVPASADPGTGNTTPVPTFPQPLDVSWE